MSIAARSYRGPSNSSFLGVTNNDQGIGTKNKKVGPFELPKPDKTGSHAISTWNTLQCKSMGESIYSDNIKRSVNGSTSTNPNIIKSDIIREPHEPKPEKFVYDTRLASTERFCGCDETFMENSDKILKAAPVVIGVLIVAALCVLLWIVVKKHCPKRSTTPDDPTQTDEGGMSGGFIDEDAIDII